jgi:hypothetical protein
MIYIFLTFLGIMGIFFWPIALGEALILSVIELMVFTTLGMVGIIGGYFVFANSGGEGLLKVAGILEMIGSFTSCIPFIGILGLLGVIIGVGMQLLNQFGVI